MILSAEEADQITIRLVPGPDDATTLTKAHQAELRQVLDPLVRDKELGVRPRYVALDAVGALGGYSGEFVIALASIISPIVTHALVAWIQRKPGRGLSAELYQDGTIKKLQAQTTEEFYSMVEVLKQEAQTKAPKKKKK